MENDKIIHLRQIPNKSGMNKPGNNENPYDEEREMVTETTQTDDTDEKTTFTDDAVSHEETFFEDDATDNSDETTDGTFEDKFSVPVDEPAVAITAVRDRAQALLSRAKVFSIMFVVYTVLAVIGFMAFFTVSGDLVLLVLSLSALAGGLAAFVYRGYIKKNTQSPEGCFIRVSRSRFEFKQVRDGMYQTGNIKVLSITGIMRVKNGLQLWYKSDNSSAVYLNGTIIPDTNTVLVSRECFDADDFDEIYRMLLKCVPETTEEYAGVVWNKDPAKSGNTFSTAVALCPCAMFIVCAILGIVI